MEERIARIISIIFHPLLIPTYLIAVLMNLDVFFALMIPVDARWKIISLILLTSAVFPATILLGMYRFRLIKSLMMESKEERLYPYAATTVFLFMSTYMIWQINISPVYYYCLLGASILAVITLLINIFWKISAHTVSMGGVLGIFIALQSVLLINILWLVAVSILARWPGGFCTITCGHSHPGTGIRRIPPGFPGNLLPDSLLLIKF